MPSFTTEPRNVRSVIGDKAKFKLTFSGLPPPGIFKSFLISKALNFNQNALYSYYLVP